MRKPILVAAALAMGCAAPAVSGEPDLRRIKCGEEAAAENERAQAGMERLSLAMAEALERRDWDEARRLQRIETRTIAEMTIRSMVCGVQRAH